jgi:O-antigen/teichoic acid export membrane protein
VIEEASFLPPFLVLIPMPIGHLTATSWALRLADIGAAAYGWIVLARRGMFVDATRPTRSTVVSVLSYGARGQVGGVMTLLNLRLDFILLGSLSDAAVVGSYAVASKFAELLRVPSLAMNYVLYPRFAREGPDLAARNVRRLAPRALLLMAVCAALVAAAVGPLIPWIYGDDFRSAVAPAYVLVAGLVTDGVGAVVSAWLLGCGRPGLNSLAIGAGVAITVLLDIALIPSHQAMGAAIASAAAYITVTGSLLIVFGMARRASDRDGESADMEPNTPNRYGTAVRLQQLR